MVPPPSNNSAFIWPGEEGFKDFPKSLPDDCVEYTIHVISATLGSDAKIRSRLQEIRNGATDLMKKHLKGYIWQRDGFDLHLVPEIGGGFLQGKTNYGDSIADEWLIVYLLRELSRRFQDAWVRVSDADGEFLLIEAANVLPRWLNPEVADYRVWLNSGELRIIPLDKAGAGAKSASSASKTLTLGQALSFIATRPAELINSPIIEEEALYRLRNYPAQIKESLHTARITVPRNLAYILHAAPAHISAAAEAFYLRDPISVKPLQSDSPSALKFLPNDLVTVSTKFTRVDFAQLKSQEFSAPEKWAVAVKEGDAASEMGMKVSCGFEMLLADPQNQDKKAVREINLLLEDLENCEPLPTDKEIATWPADEDDEKWLDVNFEDFENELAGRKGASQPTNAGDFGDKAAQENLRKIVEKFEQFLNDDDAGAEGAEFGDEMDFNDDESESISSGEDRDASFDEEEFANAMREMMGLPPEPANGGHSVGALSENRVQELDSSDEEDDEEQIKEMSQRMESELKEFGALNLDTPAATRITNGGQSNQNAAPLGEESSEYQLAKNFLESFKSQAGMAGPAGNMMNIMGLKMPRDEEDSSKERNT